MARSSIICLTFPPSTISQSTSSTRLPFLSEMPPLLLFLLINNRDRPQPSTSRHHMYCSFTLVMQTEPRSAASDFIEAAHGCTNKALTMPTPFRLFRFHLLAGLSGCTAKFIKPRMKSSTDVTALSCQRALLRDGLTIVLQLNGGEVDCIPASMDDCMMMEKVANVIIEDQGWGYRED